MKLIHVGFINRPQQGKSTLYLRMNSDQLYSWFEEKPELPGQEIELSIKTPTIEDAMRLAHRNFRTFAFRTLICGFRYSLPERDEHGINALFSQMAASYSSPGGIYFDEEVGHNCIVHNSSLEAQQLLRRLKEQNRL